MSNLQISKNWEQIKTRLLQEHPALTPADLALEAGKEEELLLHLQKKLGKTEKEIYYLLDMMG
ncbi:CsbD family protein [Chitinophagaceae bacterium MMS25-I14]